jgi:transposase-like protein
MNICPYCKSNERQNKNGRTGSGSQQYRCGKCGRRYTPQPKQAGYPKAMRQQAAQLYADGLSLRQIARKLGVVHRTVSLWVEAQAAQPSCFVAVIKQDEPPITGNQKNTSA